MSSIGKLSGAQGRKLLKRKLEQQEILLTKDHKLSHFFPTTRVEKDDDSESNTDVEYDNGKRETLGDCEISRQNDIIGDSSIIKGYKNYEMSISIKTMLYYKFLYIFFYQKKD